jgi:hypothetical protein
LRFMFPSSVITYFNYVTHYNGMNRVIKP